MLASLISLRDDIISGDYRSLYLIWLKVNAEDVIQGYGNVDKYSEEPDVPDGLKNLNGPLSEFVAVFDIDQDVISASSEISEPLDFTGHINYSHCVEKLSNQEKNEWLMRLIHNEPFLSEKLKRCFTNSEVSNKSTLKRTVSEIVEKSLSIKNERKAEANRIKKEKQLTKLKNIEGNESSLWIEVYSLIKHKKSNAYDEAVQHLRSLKELAVHKDRYGDFKEKVLTIMQENKNLSGLKRRIISAKLMNI